MKKIKISSINLAQQTWFQNGFNNMWIPKAVQSLENICDPRLWTIGILTTNGLLDHTITSFMSTKDGIKIPVTGGKLSYTSIFPADSYPHIVVCEYNSDNVLLNRKYQLLQTESITLNANTTYIRVSIGSGFGIPTDANRASIYGLRFNISNH